MSKHWDGKEISLMYYGRKAIMAVYRGLKLVAQMGNFFTLDGRLFATKDGETFEVRDEN